MAVLDLLGTCHAFDDLQLIKVDVLRYLPLMLTKVPPQRHAMVSQTELSEVGVWEPRWKMVFTWQCPTMFMSYSVYSFLGGLTIYVCTPLIRRDTWGAGNNVSTDSSC